MPIHNNLGTHHSHTSFGTHPTHKNRRCTIYTYTRFDKFLSHNSSTDKPKPGMNDPDNGFHTCSGTSQLDTQIPGIYLLYKTPFGSQTHTPSDKRDAHKILDTNLQYTNPDNAAPHICQFGNQPSHRYHVLDKPPSHSLLGSHPPRSGPDTGIGSSNTDKLTRNTPDNSLSHRHKLGSTSHRKQVHIPKSRIYRPHNLLFGIDLSGTLPHTPLLDRRPDKDPGNPQPYRCSDSDLLHKTRPDSTFHRGYQPGTKLSHNLSRIHQSHRVPDNRIHKHNPHSQKRCN